MGSNIGFIGGVFALRKGFPNKYLREIFIKLCKDLFETVMSHNIFFKAHPLLL